MVEEEDSIVTFDFPITNIEGDDPMENMCLSTLPNFNGLSTEDPYTSLFEFNVLWRSYDYVSDEKKLKPFPITLKGASLHWFMGLGRQIILTWEDMKHMFLHKYQEYCKA